MVGKTKDTLEKLPATQIVDSLFEDAINKGANFIHIEPTADSIIIKFRVNGKLVEASKILKKRYISVVERLKSLANINLRERRIPQDGKLTSKINNVSYNFSIFIIPTVNGERVTIKIQKDSTDLPSLVQLGLWGPQLSAITSFLSRQKGLMIVSGPTDSGKSTTIYSILGNLSGKENSVATLEDPVEYKLAGVNQTQINQKTNLTFLSGLQAILKHDTNVIMLSELRDLEVAKLVMDASGQGRLFISSLYVDEAASVITNLRNMGLTAASVAHNLKVVTSQRLVRKLCQNCRESYKPDRASLIKITDLFSIGNKSSMRYLHRLEQEYITESNSKKVTKSDLSSSEDTIKILWKANEKGCKNCNQTGYDGRIGIFEAMVISASIQKLIVGQASTRLLHDQAVKEGMVSIQLDGLVKALVGVTSIDEVLRFGIEEIVN